MASFVLSELCQVGVEATLRSIDTVEWYAIYSYGRMQEVWLDR